ncbi:Transposon TX1 uncharacterized 149 kDa protein, partial [Linum perenne]
FWIHHQGYLDCVKKAWTISASVDPVLNLFRNQKNLKVALKAFNSTTFSDISVRVKSAVLALADVQLRLLSSPSSELVAEEILAISNLLSLQQVEEGFLRQKARIRYIAEGDQNSSFFHRSVKVRTTFNTIRHITSSDGHTIVDPDGIVAEFVGFYKNLLGTENSSVVPPSVETLKSTLNKFLTSDHCSILCKEVTKDEIKQVMFRMDGNHAAGPDGFNANFYKSSWSIIEEDFTAAVLDFFRSSKLLSEFNVTSLTLIPKVPSPSLVREF